MSEGDAGRDLEVYQGLVAVTARMYARACGLEPDDLAQLLWVKIWQTRPKYDPARSGQTEERFVYGCMKNRIKDLIRDRNRQELRQPDPLLMAEGESGELVLGSITIYRERFEERYLATSEDQVYSDVEEGRFRLPATITQTEAHVIVLLMEGYTQRDIAIALGVHKKRVRSYQDSIEAKLADWAPPSPTSEAPLALSHAA